MTLSGANGRWTLQTLPRNGRVSCVHGDSVWSDNVLRQFGRKLPPPTLNHMHRLLLTTLLLALPLTACDATARPPLQAEDLVTFEYWYTQKSGTYCAAVHLNGSGPALGRTLDLTLLPLRLSEADYERTGGTFLMGGQAVQLTATCQRPNGAQEVGHFNGVVPRDPADQHPLVLLVRPEGFSLGLATRVPARTQAPY